MAIKSTGLTQKGIRSEFFMRYNTTPQIYPDLVTTVPNQGSNGFEVYKMLGAVPLPREWKGPRQVRDVITEDFVIVNRKYELTVEVDRQELEREQTAQIRQRINDMATRARQLPDSLLTSLIQANGVCYDGQNFFDTDHASGESGTQDNALTSNIASPSAPTIIEFSEALRGMIQAMMGFKDEAGQPLWVDATGLIVMVPTNMAFTAMQVLNSSLIADATNSTTGVASQDNVLRGAATLRVNPFLTNTDRFFLFKTNASIRPFIYQPEVPLEFVMKDRPDDDNAFSEDKYVYGTREVLGMGYGRWQNAIQHVFT